MKLKSWTFEVVNGATSLDYMDGRENMTAMLKDPYSDSAEYKMWGNGVALPCVWFVLCGIVWYAQSGGDNAPI